jgi:ribosomal protein L29
MKKNEIRELTPDELRARKRELREQIFHLRLQQAGGSSRSRANSAPCAAKLHASKRCSR